MSISNEINRFVIFKDSMILMTKWIKNLLAIFFTFGVLVADTPNWDCDGAGFDGSNFSYTGSMTTIAYIGIAQFSDENGILAAFVEYFTCDDGSSCVPDDGTCDDECDQLLGDYCTIFLDGFIVDQDNTLADKFTVTTDYALEAFGIYLDLHPDANPLYDHSATIKIHSDNNNTPGAILGEWTIDIGNAYYYSLYVGDGCISLDANSSYWISAHVDDPNTQLVWLYTQAPFYTFAQTTDNGETWDASEYGVAGAAAIWAEQIYYTDWQPAENESADVNLDGTTNILDVVQLVQFVLGNINFSDEQIDNADFNQDGAINVLDVVSIVNLILFGTVDPMPGFSLEDINPASDYYGEYIGPETFRDDISLYYFGKAG